ncbi:hypothetical protein GOBAR_DD30323 [Gossypium barbadense]|nr:hypothetical protein GOBAR_DD30323 [Gossypium barbadense]
MPCCLGSFGWAASGVPGRLVGPSTSRLACACLRSCRRWPGVCASSCCRHAASKLAGWEVVGQMPPVGLVVHKSDTETLSRAKSLGRTKKKSTWTARVGATGVLWPHVLCEGFLGLWQLRCGSFPVGGTEECPSWGNPAPAKRARGPLRVESDQAETPKANVKLVGSSLGKQRFSELGLSRSGIESAGRILGGGSARAGERRRRVPSGRSGVSSVLKG